MGETTSGVAPLHFRQEVCVHFRSADDILWHILRLIIPRVLVCSQLPTDITFPTRVTVRVLEEQAGVPEVHSMHQGFLGHVLK